MSNTDFFDDDLIKKRETASRMSIGSSDGILAEAVSTEAPDSSNVLRGTTDVGSTRMEKHRDEVEDQVAKTTEELERLRQRQEGLEKERRDLQELRSRQDEFEESRRDVIDKLGQTILTLEREQIRVEQAADLIGSTRQRFKTMLGELEDLDAEAWEETKIRDELGKGIAIIEDARIEFKKSMAKVQAVREQGSDVAEDSRIYDRSKQRAKEARSFGYWSKVGLAVSLPMIITTILVAAALYALFTWAPF